MLQSPGSHPRPHASVYEIVTEQVIRQLESGVAPWRKPWRTELPCNLVSGKEYRA
jgi:antirestriction protein ArdC